MHPLPVAPSQAIVQGEPQFGLYQGTVGLPNWRSLTGAFQKSGWWRFAHHKQWHYAALMTPELMLGLAVVNVGYAANGFLYLFDRQAKRMLVNRSQVMPPFLARVGLPAEGADTRFRAPGLNIALTRRPGSPLFQLEVQGGDGLQVAAELDMSEAPAPFTAIARIPEGVANCTQKFGCIPIRGEIRLGDRHFDLGGGNGTLDHTNGLLARDTRWRWASGHSRRFGFNLVEGFNDEIENVLWLDGDLVQVGRVRFAFDPQAPMAPWRITSPDGRVDLTFQPEGLRHKHEDLMVAMSRYIQPVGSFSGTLRATPEGPAFAIQDVTGVTEDHQARW